MGTAMAATAIALIYSPWGRRSGAHFNPAVTLTFLRLGKVAPRDFVGYTLAQFVGGAAGVFPGINHPRRRTFAPCRELRRHAAGHGGRADGVHGRVRHHRDPDDRRAHRFESPALCPLHGALRGLLRRDVHHVRSAALGHELEPRPQLRQRAGRRGRVRSGSISPPPPFGMLVAAQLFLWTQFAARDVRQTAARPWALHFLRVSPGSSAEPELATACSPRKPVRPKCPVTPPSLLLWMPSMSLRCSFDSPRGTTSASREHRRYIEGTMRMNERLCVVLLPAFTYGPDRLTRLNRPPDG